MLRNSWKPLLENWEKDWATAELSILNQGAHNILKYYFKVNPGLSRTILPLFQDKLTWNSRTFPRQMSFLSIFQAVITCLLHSAQYNIVQTVQGSSSNDKSNYYLDLYLKVWKSTSKESWTVYKVCIKNPMPHICFQQKKSLSWKSSSWVLCYPFYRIRNIILFDKHWNY